MSLKKTFLGGLLLAGFAGLAGCAGQHSATALQQAGADFQKVKEDSNVLRIAPKDVIRAGESLARADRLSTYWGSGADAGTQAGKMKQKGLMWVLLPKGYTPK